MRIFIQQKTGNRRYRTWKLWGFPENLSCDESWFQTDLPTCILKLGTFFWLTVHSVTIGQWWVKDRHLSHWVERPFDPESYYVAAGWARVVRHGSKWSLVSEMESEIDIPMKNTILLNNMWLTTFQGLLNRDFLFDLLNFLQISGFLTLPTQTTPTPKTEGWTAAKLQVALRSWVEEASS